MIEMQTVSSPFIHAIGYDDEVQELYVKFSSGSLYAYSNIDASVWEDFKAAESKGRFLNDTIKKQAAAYRKVDL